MPVALDTASPKYCIVKSVVPPSVSASFELSWMERRFDPATMSLPSQRGSIATASSAPRSSGAGSPRPIGASGRGSPPNAVAAATAKHRHEIRFRANFIVVVSLVTV